MSPAPITVYHNPRCSKSRATVQILEARNARFTLYHYLDERPDAATIRSVMAALGISDPRDMMRTKEAEYAEQDLTNAGADGLIQAMAACPKLIERPIVLAGDRGVIARPPERVEEFLVATQSDSPATGADDVQAAD